VSYAYNFFYNTENERYIFTKFFFNKKQYNLFLDKTTNKYFLFNEFNEGIGFSIDGFFEKGCYCAIDIEYLKKYTTPELLDTENKIIYRNLNAESNPVIVEYYF